MYNNPLSSIREAKVFTSLLVAIMTNSIVFATPVSQAMHNFSLSTSSKNISSINTADDFSIRNHSSSQGEWTESNLRMAIYSATEKHGEIGVPTSLDADYIQDNYFTISIPDLDSHQGDHAILHYDIYGVDEKGATKSINNNASYGGKHYQNEATWKTVEEYIPITFLQSGENEIFFNRHKEEVYAYQVKNVQITFQKVLTQPLQEAKKEFEASWKTLPSGSLIPSLEGQNHFENFSILSEIENTTGWVYGLSFKDLKPLPRELHNVTQGNFRGYRWVGSSPNGKLKMHYDPSAIPVGYSLKDVKVYYFDAATRHWSPLPEIEHDYENQTLTALIIENDNGDTDYISGVITQPEHPEVAAFTPTQISDIEYADPTSGVVSISPPSANSRGVAQTSFPIKLPAGRNGMQPQLSIDYNSEGANGWLGKGWDLSFSSISVDTKWGVPEYHTTKETEVYSLDGQELVLKEGSQYTNAHRNENITRNTTNPNRTFYLRKEGAYLEVTRHGSTPSNYWWSVTDTQGYTSYYGGVTALQRNSVLSKTLNGGAIAQWALVRMEDPYGNYVDYTYSKRNFTVSPSVTAQEFYQNKITYTRHSEASNYYEVTFIRDSITVPESQRILSRKDITTNGRFGFLTANSSLLGEIQIQYVKGSTRQAIRYYTLDYKEDSYGHNLLTKISEYDSEKKLFYSNTLEYYDEIGSGATIESDSEVWDIDEKPLKTPLYTMANPALRGLLSDGSSLGASESYGFSVAGRLGVGIGKNPNNITNTVGFGLNYAQNNQETKISFIDINGDGLPDKVLSTSSGVYYRPNTGEGFGNLQPIFGVNNLSKTKTRSNSFSGDANALGMFGVGYSKNKSKSTTDYYFIDFNGDGLPDLVSNYGVRFNVTKRDNDYTMREFVTNDSDRTENPIDSGEISTDILDDIHFETLDELRALFPQYDHVKMWTAPYNGTVNVTGTAKLLTLNSCEFDNSFKLTLEKFTPSSTNELATLLHTSSLVTLGQQRSFSQSGIMLEKGDVLFFRTHNQEYGCGGEVEWNPKITYTSIPNIPNQEDENGLLLRQYDAKQDFILNNGANWAPNEEATSVNVNFDLNNGRFNSISITDDIRFKVEKIRMNNNTGESQVDQTFTRTYNHKTKTFSGTGNLFTNSINTTNTYSYSYHFSAESSSNIAWHQLQWQPTMTSMGRIDTAPVSYSNFEKPLFQTKHWIAASDLPAITSIPSGLEHTDYIKLSHDLIDMPTSLSASTMNSRLQVLEDNGVLPLPVDWVVKTEIEGEIQVLYKKTLYLMPKPGGGFGFSRSQSAWLTPITSDSNFYLSRTQVQQLQQSGSAIYAGFYTFNEEFKMFDKAEVSFTPVQSLIQPPPALAQINTPIFVPEYTFSGATYRGWREFLYNGGLLLKEVDGEVELDNNGNPIILEDYGETLLRAKRLFESNYDEGNLEDLQDQINEENPENFSALAGDNVYFTYIQNHEKKQYDNASIQNAFYGISAISGTITQGLGRFGTADLAEYYIDPQTLLDGTAGTFVGLKLFSRSNGESKSGNILVTEGTLSTGTSKNENQYIDLNGDGYPDLITQNKIQYTNMLGALHSVADNTNAFIERSKEEDFTVGATLAALFSTSAGESSPSSPSSASSTPTTTSNNITNTNIYAGVNNSNGRSYDISQWIDINGDGLPDQIRITESGIFVRLNTGYGFANEKQWDTSISLRSTSDRINFGMGMGGSFFTPFPTVEDPLPKIVSINPSFGFGLGASTSKARTNVQLVDVNGDGLPDLVYKIITSSLSINYYYQANTGSGFHPTPLLLHNSHVEEDKTLAGNIYGTATFGFLIPLFIITLKVTGTPTAGVNAALSEKTIRFQDIDGDGLPDVLSQVGDGTSIRVRRNQTGKTGLLKKVNTPLGGSWTIDYKREGNTYEMASSKWVLAEVKTHDGFTADNPWDDAKSETLTTFTYENAYYDRRDRTFYGFEKLVSEQRHPQTQTVLGYQEQKFLNQDYYTQGTLIETRSYDANDQLLARQSNYYNLVKPEQMHTGNLNTDANHLYRSSGLGEMDRTRASLLLVKSVATEYEGSQSRSQVQHFNTFSAIGNILTYENIGSSVSDSYLASITYKSDPVYKRLPITIEIRSKSTNELLKKRTAQYDNKGSVTESVVYLEVNKTNRVQYKYDAFGNRTHINKLDVRPENGAGNYGIEIGYDPEVHTYPIGVSDSYNESSSMVYDYLFGVPVEVTDRAGSRLRTRIDNRGRAIEITGPKEFPNGWTIRMEYQGEDAVATQVQSNHARNTDYRFHTAKGKFEAVAPGTSQPTNKQHYAVTRHNVAQAYQNELLTISIVDGFGSPIQVKKTHLSGTTRKWQVSGKEHTDVFGRNIKSYQLTTQSYPSNIHQLGSSDLSFSTAVTNLPPLETHYDTKDRAIRIQQPGESSATTIEYALQQNIFIERVENELGQSQETHTDLRGRQIKSIQNDNITTKFYYNVVSDLLRVRNHAGFDTEYTYNMGGLRTREAHPDRGVTSFAYDNAGRMMQKKTSNLEANQSIEYTYHYDRLTKMEYPNNPLHNVAYTYGTAGNSTGRISEQRDAVGIQRFQYGNQGELTEQMSAMAVAGKTSYWFKTQWSYDSWGRVRSITYPDEEQVSYSYDQAGQLEAVSSYIPGVSAHKVVNNIRYNDYGEREEITYGNGTTTNYTYDTRRRLEDLSFNFTGFQQTKEYSYDALSNILGIESTTSTNPATGVLGGPVSHSYTYDDYNRLIHANGHYVGPNDHMPEMLRQEYSLDMLYDESHSILTKSQSHRMGEVANLGDALTSSADYAPTAYHLEYEDYNRGQYTTDGYTYTQPHAPRIITQYPVDRPNDPRDPRVDKQFLDYDANGNITHIEREVNNPYMPMDSARESVRKFVWDEEDRLMGVDLRPESSRNQPHISAYTYDAGGERGIRYVPRQQEGVSSGATAGYAQDMDIMLYPNALITVRPQELPEDFEIGKMHPSFTFTTYTKHYYIGSERINSKLGTVKDLGILCEQMGGNDLIGEMNRRVEEAGERLEDLHTDLDKDLRLNSLYPYSREHQIVCDFKSHDSELYDAYWYHPDHLGSSSYITNTTGEISQHMEYLPFGETLVEEHLNSYNSPFKFNAKEFDAETGNYYYGARYMNPKWSTFLTPDPALESYPGISPYAYTLNNPVRYVDPTGMYVEENPIYDTKGDFLGTDDKGLHGEAIVMHKANFKQSMSHNEAMAYNLGNNTGLMSAGAKSKMNTHFAGLKDRPDYDGFVTIADGIKWAKEHPNTLPDNITPDNSLYLDASKLNFGNLSVVDLENLGFIDGVKDNVNLLNYVNLFSKSSRATTYALGNTQMKLLDSKSGKVQLYWDDYDWDVHQGGNENRNRLIRGERTLKGLDDSHGFRVFIYGTGKIKTE